MTIRERTGVSARELTTLRVGGICKTVFDATTSADVVEIVSDHPTAICIGGGSNLLVSQEGLKDPLIRLYDETGEIDIDAATARVRVDASTNWDALVQRTIDAGLAGLECMSGIPGSVGGGCVQNVGAYGQEIADVFVSLTAFDRQNNALTKLSADEMRFRYRSSLMKHDAQRRYIVTDVELQLHNSSISMPKYADVADLLRKRHGALDAYQLADVRNAVRDVRRSKGMLVDEGAPSAGSFFTNPEVPRARIARIDHHPGVRIIREMGDVVRLSAAALISGAGFHKGLHHSGAAISDHHVLAIVNNDDATADDIIALANIIRTGVYEHFGIDLTPEPVMLGFSQNPFPPLG